MYKLNPDGEYIAEWMKRLEDRGYDCPLGNKVCLYDYSNLRLDISDLERGLCTCDLYIKKED